MQFFETSFDILIQTNYFVPIFEIRILKTDLKFAMELTREANLLLIYDSKSHNIFIIYKTV